MHIRSPSRVRAPYGVAFPVHELVFIRAWAEGRGLALEIVLDRILEGKAFEELLIVRGLVHAGGALTLWRLDGGSVMAQAEGGTPHAYGGIHAALSQAAVMFSPQPVQAPSAWRRVFYRRRG